MDILQADRKNHGKERIKEPNPEDESKGAQSKYSSGEPKVEIIDETPVIRDDGPKINRSSLLEERALMNISGLSRSFLSNEPKDKNSVIDEQR